MNRMVEWFAVMADTLSCYQWGFLNADQAEVQVFTLAARESGHQAVGVVSCLTIHSELYGTNIISLFIKLLV